MSNQNAESSVHNNLHAEIHNQETQEEKVLRFECQGAAFALIKRMKVRGLPTSLRITHHVYEQLKLHPVGLQTQGQTQARKDFLEKLRRAGVPAEKVRMSKTWRSATGSPVCEIEIRP